MPVISALSRQANMVYIVSSSSASATQQDYVSTKQNKTTTWKIWINIIRNVGYVSLNILRHALKCTVSK